MGARPGGAPIAVVRLGGAGAGRRVYFAGDTAWHPEFDEIARRFGPFDAVLIPIGAYSPRWMMSPVHMDPPEAVRAYQSIAGVHATSGWPRPAMVPIHWGTFRLSDEPLDEPPQRLTALWREAALPDDALWLLRHGETRRGAGLRSTGPQVHRSTGPWPPATASVPGPAEAAGAGRNRSASPTGGRASW